ncbi:hypothetical protein CONLIGDRAFT_668822 [Coniochaeta ligniaria NRRL 30616]|uniref:Pectin lyase-like protein n=1 Tax=Coniochaeta ligniaria NRRL 30616 TaxID=1408157 RepID=A0A1J7JM47_9PEZI|nr:hypothetical protein CONLIGDRAFT_668822 [Coniochaeta ligniaria NRRL 30616]
MKGHSITDALVLAFVCSAAARPQATADTLPMLTADYRYIHASSSDLDSHRNYQLHAGNSCGFLLDYETVLSLLDSNISKPAYTGNAQLTPIYGSAAVCVANQSTFDFIHGSISTSGDRQVGVWVYGPNATAHVTDVLIENKNSDIAFGLVAEEEAVLRADLVNYSSDSRGTCAFVADGGEITIHDSIARSRAEESSIFCSLGGGDALGQIHSQEVVAISEKGPAVVLSGNTELAAFTNTTFSAGGPAAIISTRVGSGVLQDTVLRVTTSQITSTNPTSPVLLFTLKDIDAIFYRTDLVPSQSNILLHTACSSAAQAGDCRPFQATVLMAESSIVGDIQAWDPAYLFWELSSYTTWTGAVASNTTTGVYGTAPVDVYIDDTSSWHVTKESWVQVLESARGDLSNIVAVEPGVVVHYNASALANEYLEGRTVELQGGGLARPY